MKVLQKYFWKSEEMYQLHKLQSVLTLFQLLSHFMLQKLTLLHIPISTKSGVLPYAQLIQNILSILLWLNFLFLLWEETFKISTLTKWKPPIVNILKIKSYTSQQWQTKNGSYLTQCLWYWDALKWSKMNLLALQCLLQL